MSEFWNVFPVMAEPTRLNATIPLALPSNRLLLIVICCCGFNASVEEKSTPASPLPVKVFASISTFCTVPPPTNWSV